MIRPTVVGVYSVSGAGKSHALSELSRLHPEWRCLEGSEVIEEVLLDQHGRSFDQFRLIDEEAKDSVRTAAIQKIKGFRGLTLVTGHCSFPDVSDADVTSFKDVFTSGDGETYDFIFYLDTASDVVFQQRNGDSISSKRARLNLSEDVLEQWMQHEKTTLKQQCDQHGIRFETVKNLEQLTNSLDELVIQPLVDAAKKQSKEALREAIQTLPSADVYLLLDGDRTLCADDTGKLFFDHVFEANSVDRQKQIFQRYKDYTFQAFLEVAMLYERVVEDADYNLLSEKTASAVSIYCQWTDFLGRLPENVHPILVSSGNREIWETLLKLQGFSVDAETGIRRMSLLAGNHIGLHPYILDSQGKGLVVSELRRKVGGCMILAFGDSAVDVPMLESADRGYIVLDDRCNRSMKPFLRAAVASSSNHRLHQLCVSDTPEPIDSGAWHDGIQVACLENLLHEFENNGALHTVEDCSRTSAAAAVLATQTRRSDLTGPALQAIHCDVGRFLSDRLLDAFPVRLVQQSDFSHVQGTTFAGETTRGASVLIVPLMRGGEPMSRGVHERFPTASMFHWDDDQGDLSVLERLLTAGTVTDVILVDSVINEGRSMRRVLNRMQGLVPSALRERTCFHVLTAVMQQQAAASLPFEYPRARFLTLRVSDNKYKGKGGTDTGNRLFGTC